MADRLPTLDTQNGSITTRVASWAIAQLRREHATVHSFARQLGTSWKTVWRTIQPKLVKLADNESLFEIVATLGVDEHIWHHVDPRKHGSKQLTGMVDLTRVNSGKTRARLPDMVPDQSGRAYASWLGERNDALRKNVELAAFDPSAGYKSAIVDKLEDATAVLDAFHVVKLGIVVADEVQRRIARHPQPLTPPKRPLHAVQTILRTGTENLTETLRARLISGIEDDPTHDEVFFAWQSARRQRSDCHQKELAERGRIAQNVIDLFHTGPIPEIARLGHTPALVA